MHWYFDVLKKYVVFSGRASRQEFWMFVLLSAVVSLLLGLIGTMLSPVASAFQYLSVVYSVAVFLPSLAVAVRRLHDIDKSGWWLFINLVPVVGFVVYFIFLVLDSKPGTNQYGPNPKGVNTSGSASTI